MVAMFEFADVTENGICVGTSNCPLASSAHWRLLFKRYIHVERIVSTRENRKYEWNNLYF